MRVNAAYQHRSLVLSLAIASFALVFTTFVVFEVPGLGIAHLFYLPVAALALTGGVRRGILAGAIAVAPWATADVITGGPVIADDTNVRTGRGTFDTLTGNALQR